MLYIGAWVARYRVQDGEATWLTKAHYVESEIADRIVTNCGREMYQSTKEGYLVATTEQKHCSQCEGED